MIPVEQRSGFDCMTACLASIFEVPYEEAPQLAQALGVPKPDWLKTYFDWCASRGFYPQDFYVEGEPKAECPWAYRGYWIAGVRSPRWNGQHAVVMHDREIAWDPYPGDPVPHRGFVNGEIFLPLDVARFELRPRSELDWTARTDNALAGGGR